jgi:glycosyltransferase involved in cell wall biosynthesis
MNHFNLIEKFGGGSSPIGKQKAKPAQLTTLFTLFLFSLTSQAQIVQPSGTGRTTFAGSIRKVAPAGSQIPSESSATLLQKELTQAQTEATIEFSIPLKMRDFSGLQDRLAKLEIISPDEMESSYDPTPADYKIVADWLTSEGFTVKPAQRTNLSVFASGSVTQIERAFATKFARVAFAGTESSSAEIAPSMPAAIASSALGVNGLQPYLHPRAHSNLASGQPQKLTNNLPPYKVSEIAKAYNANGLSVNGSNQKIAIVIDTFPAPSDLTAFWQANAIAQSLNNIEKVQVVAGTLPSPSGEESLDVEWSSSMAPGAKVRVYATTDLSFVHIDQAYQAIINDLPSQPALHQVSLSYGLGDTYESPSQMQTDAQYFASLAANGVTVFVSSGDGGSTPGLSGYGDNSGPVQVECPANDPHVTSVGGTSLNLVSATGAVSSESAWSLGGGGSSQFFARPSWQFGAGVPAGSFRTVPDIALVADLNTGGFLSSNAGPYDWIGRAAAIFESTASPEDLVRRQDPRCVRRPILFFPEVVLDLTGEARMDWARTLGVSMACIFYDMLPMYASEYVSDTIKTTFSSYLDLVLQMEALWAISEYSLNELQRYCCGTLEQKLRKSGTIWLPGQFSDYPRATVGSVPTRKVSILCVSTFESRKNHLALIQAFQSLRVRRPDLSITLKLVGNRHAEENQLFEQIQKAADADNQIKLVGNVGDSILGAEYEDATFTVYPSLIEGFGLPILESLWMGRPCICNATGVMGELAVGGGCLTVDMKSPLELEIAIERLATDTALLGQLSEQALSRDILTWRTYSDAIANELLRL